MGFLMIPLTTVYDDYICHAKLTEQKKPSEYIIPPPTKVGWYKKIRLYFCLMHIGAVNDKATFVHDEKESILIQNEINKDHEV